MGVREDDSKTRFHSEKTTIRGLRRVTRFVGQGLYPYKRWYGADNKCHFLVRSLDSVKDYTTVQNPEIENNLLFFNLP